MNLKIKFNFIKIILFTTFFFFWANYSWDFVWSFIDVKKFHFLFDFQELKQEGFIKLRPSYLIILLLLPILLQYVNKRTAFLNLLFNNQKFYYLFYLLLFIIFYSNYSMVKK